jgi:hypothetical protein
MSGTRKDRTYTITLGDVAESHVGTEKIGTLASAGLSVQD